MMNSVMGRAGVIVLMLAAGALGDTVELPLTGCAGFYDINTPAWTMDFDLGVSFSEAAKTALQWPCQRVQFHHLCGFY